jgi:hypothetical protein
MYWIHHIPAQYENAAEVSPCIKIANIRRIFILGRDVMDPIHRELPDLPACVVVQVWSVTWIHHIPAQYENAAEVSPCIKIANIRLECKRAIICSLIARLHSNRILAILMQGLTSAAFSYWAGM